MRQLYRFISLSAMAGLATAALFAQNNLLENAISHNAADLNDKDAFYSVWQLHDKEGRSVSTENAPFSCFSQVGAVWTPNGGYMNTNGEFKSGDCFLKLDYPHAEADIDYNYNFPVNIPAQGDYVLEGVVAILDYGENANTLGNFINTASWVIVTADERPCEKVFEIRTDVSGKNYFSVTRKSDGADVPFVSVPVHTDSKTSCSKLDGTMSLTPDIKYLSFYMPAHVMALKDLSFKSTVEVSVMDIVSGDHNADMTPEYMDLDGRRRGSDASVLAPGIYIEKRGTQIRKIAVR